jgi:transposase-like protein
MKTAKPSCPNKSCTNAIDYVKTLGGGSSGKYRYMCYNCKTQWQQNRISNSTEDSGIVIGSRNRDQYKCKDCGLPKKGHTCTIKQTRTARTSAVPKHFSQNNYVPPSPSLFPVQEMTIPFSGYQIPPPPPSSS